MIRSFYRDRISEPASFNGGPDDDPYRRLSRGERTHSKGRCRRCANPIVVANDIEGYGRVCSWVCVLLVAEAQERERKAG